MYLGSIPPSAKFAIATPAATASFMPLFAELLELCEGLGASDFSLLAIGSDREPTSGDKHDGHVYGYGATPYPRADAGKSTSVGEWVARTSVGAGAEHTALQVPHLQHEELEAAVCDQLRPVSGI